MRFPFVVSIAYISAVVSAAGYQGCLERVHLFQAYEVDGLLQPGDRILGFKCRDWDQNVQQCRNGDYEECAGSRPGGRCNFDELMNSMNPAREQRNWAAGRYQANGRIDIQQTAVQCYNRYQGRGAPVPNFPAWKAMKGNNVHEFNDYIRRLGDRVDFVYRKQSGTNNGDYFKDFDNTRDRINIARAGDHGPFLIEEANERVGGVYTQDLGRNPATNENWMTVDWAETANRARANGDNAVAGRIRNFLNDFYGRGAARQHYMVFRSYKYTNDRAVSCGRRGMQHV